MEITQETRKERVILVGISTGDARDAEASLDELGELAETAGAETVGRMLQNREQAHPGTYLGKGKIEELQQMADALEADAILCDDELTPAQQRNLQQELDQKVMDRTLVILDIFAAHASTGEGKIQVELAQLKYRQARLVGLRDALSRLGGGIGTRGPGEKKLEMDRRLIRDRIAQLNKELEAVKRSREVARGKRSRSAIPVAAIVGYTNAGKSTLLNALTGAQVLEEDKLFATLDPVTRVLQLPSGQEMLVTDTVGFIRKLPHHLIDAFRSTLEEAKYADIILHVVDASNPQAGQQMQVVYDTLKDLGVMGKPVVTLFNKQDLAGEDAPTRDAHADACLPICAKRKEGLDALREKLEELLNARKVRIERLYQYKDAGCIQLIRRQGQLVTEEYRNDGIYVLAYVPMEIYGAVTPE